MSIIKSMTGIAVVNTHNELGSFELCIKAVNSRFADVNYSSNTDLGALELECTRRIKDLVKRGNISVQFSYTPNSNQDFTVNDDKLNELFKALEHIKEQASQFDSTKARTPGILGDLVSKPISLLEIAQFPGIINNPNEEQGSNRNVIAQEQQASFESNFIALLEQALTKFDAHRCKEGNNLKTVILAKLDALSLHLDKIQDLLDELVPMERERIKAKIAQLQIELEPQRLDAEIALTAQKADIAEEHDRLRSHIKTARELLNEEQESYAPVGKKLDFLMQEFNREANTIASKANYLETTSTAVEMKVLIEQMREQVQNIE